MHHRVRLVSLLSLSAACAGAHGCSSEPEGNPDLGARLESDTGVPWAAHQDERSHDFRALAPKAPVRIGEGTPEQTARAFFNRYRDALHATGDARELRAAEPVVDDDGTQHVAFEHYLPGTEIPVFDVVSLAHFTKSGEAYLVQPGFRADLAHVPTTARITKEDAVARATARAVSDCAVAPELIELGNVRLGVRAEEGAPASLVWRVRMTTSSESCTAPVVVVDAMSGDITELRETAESLWDTGAKGTRYFHQREADDIKGIDVTRRGREFVLESEPLSKVITKNFRANMKPADITSATLGTWSSSPDVDGAEVDAQYHGFHALRYFREVYKRNGLDGRYGNLYLVVHDNVNNEYGRNAKHVATDGTIVKDDYVHIGDGDFRDGGDWLPLSAAFDVIVHEAAHAVTGHTSKLAYRYESGALNESFSDVMGASAEHWFETQDRKRNFLMGERFMKSGRGLRDMENPKGLGQPDHKNDQKYCGQTELPNGDTKDPKYNDLCHVHKNSGIPNRAFSLMTVGGKNSTSGAWVVNGLGWEEASKLWYRTFTTLRPQATFFEAALAQVADAALRGPEYLQTVACAWHAVGVLSFTPPAHPVVIGIACPAPPTDTKRTQSSCEGVADGYVCNSVAPYSAFVCKNGAYVDGKMCSDLTKSCKKKAADDWTASVGSDGQLICE